MKLLRALTIVFLLFTVAVPVNLAGQAPATAPAKTATTLSETERAAMAQVKVETITNITSALAAKEMEGRGTGLPGGERAAKYLAERFEKLGLKPLGVENSYLQPVKFKTSQYLPVTTIKSGETSLTFGKDFVVPPTVTAKEFDLNGELVFIGYGVNAPTLKHDDLAELDLKGKIVVVLQGQPKNIAAADWQKEAPPSQVFINLVKRGVAGFIITNFTSNSQQPYEMIANYLSRRKVALAKNDEPEHGPERVPPIFIASNDGAEKLFQGSGSNLNQLIEKAAEGEFVSRNLGKSVTITVRKDEQIVTGSNVVAVLPGSDAKLKDQAIVYSAHYDAFGIDASGTIYPGAADNALGVAMMLSIAEAYTKLKPRHSIIFLAVTGEEYGLLGAQYWAEHATWPLDKIVADINFDGIGTEVYGPVKNIVGFGAQYSSLGNLMNDISAALDLKVMPDPFPEEQVFYRSDHYVFVKKGIPSIMMLGGPGGDWDGALARARKWLTTDYHQATDTVRADWHWEGARTMAIVGLIMGVRIDNSDQDPSWLPGAPFSRPAASQTPGH